MSWLSDACVICACIVQPTPLELELPRQTFVQKSASRPTERRCFHRTLLKPALTSAGHPNTCYKCICDELMDQQSDKTKITGTHVCCWECQQSHRVIQEQGSQLVAAPPTSSVTSWGHRGQWTRFELPFRTATGGLLCDQYLVSVSPPTSHSTTTSSNSMEPLRLQPHSSFTVQ